METANEGEASKRPIDTEALSKFMAAHTLQ